MPSSTSSSDAGTSADQRRPAARWGRLLATAGAIFVAFVVLLEAGLARRGFEPTAQDSFGLWLGERWRPAQLGRRALILVGASRIQLDVDLDLLRARTGLEPVQLAIDGGSFFPVLAGLVLDRRVVGTIIVEFQDATLAEPPQADIAAMFEAEYEQRARQWRLPRQDDSEQWLDRHLRSQLRSFADGSDPLTSIRSRLLRPGATQQYLVTLPSREQRADFTRLGMPAFYYARVVRELGWPAPFSPNADLAVVRGQIEREIGALRPQLERQASYQRATASLARMAAAVRQRGGRVIFVQFPRSGYVKEMEDRRYPRALFWERFRQQVAAPALHFEDVPAWQGLECPDGSHLDYRDQARFTDGLVRALGLSADASTAE